MNIFGSPIATVGPYTPLFRDNFAGRTLQGLDNTAGIVAALWRDGDVRGFFSNEEVSGRALQDAKMSAILFVAGPLTGAASGVKALRNGSFSIVDWAGYPASVPRPMGPFRLLQGGEYNAARTAANSANRALRGADPSLVGKQIHEIQPIKFGGSPTDLANKTPLTGSDHSVVTNWWNQLQRYLEGLGP
jgi:hypothetical protein